MLSEKIDILFTPFRLKSGCKLRNRIVFAPLYLGLAAESSGFFDFYRERARGGVGLIIAPVPTTGGLSDVATPAFRRAARRLVAVCGEQGAVVIPQIFSGVGDWVDTFDEAAVSRLPAAFARCAQDLREAGFPGMEIHGAHHSFFMHLLSPVINRRGDRYNGALEARARVQTDTVQAIRSRVPPDFTLLYRMSASDLLPDGFDVKDAQAVGRLLEAAGVDCLDVSVGGTAAGPPGSECPAPDRPEACFAPYFAAVKAAVTVPVIGAGRIVSPGCAAEVVRRGRADLVALGRALVADPAWPRKAHEGREADILPADDWYKKMPGKQA